MRAALIAALVAFVVAVGVSGAASIPVPAGQTAVQKQLTLLHKQVNRLKARQACFGRVLPVTGEVAPNGDTYILEPNAGDPDVYLASVKPECLVQP